MLPAAFALPAGWVDFAIGVTAPLIAFGLSHRKISPSQIFILWNILGILDLVMAVTLGILSSGTPLGLLAGEVTTQIMGQFPLSIIPTFLVPLFIIFHLVALARLRHENVSPKPAV